MLDSVQILVMLVVAVGFGAAEVFAGMLVVRGGLTWPGVVMIIGGVLQLSGGGMQQVANFFFMRLLATSTGVPGPNDGLIVLSQVGSFCGVLGMFLFLVGLIPVCLRLRSLRRRAGELEELNRQLAERIGGSGPGA